MSTLKQVLYLNDSLLFLAHIPLHIHSNKPTENKSQANHADLERRPVSALSDAKGIEAPRQSIGPQPIQPPTYQRTADNSAQVQYLSGIQLMADNGMQPIHSSGMVVQRMKELASKTPPKPQLEPWQLAAQQYEEEGQGEEQTDEGPAAAAAASSGNEQRRKPRESLPVAFSPEALRNAGYTQAGKQGTLFITAQRDEHHHSIECTTQGGGLVSITGGHLTNERIPEGQEGRRVRELTAEELTVYRKRAGEEQQKIEEEQLRREQQRQEQLRQAEETKQRSERMNALKAEIDSATSVGLRNISDADIAKAVENGWTIEDVKRYLAQKGEELKNYRGKSDKVVQL
jgi:hypothetical protein